MYSEFYKDMSKEQLLELLGKETASAAQAQIKLLPAVVLLGRLTEDVKAAVWDLTKSSNRLEALTKWPISLTVALALLTAVLAIPESKNAVAWLKAH